MLLAPAPAQLRVDQTREQVVVQTGRVTLTVHRRSGRCDLVWLDGSSVKRIGAEARLEDGRTLRTGSAATLEVQKVRDEFGPGLRVAVHERQPNAPELVHLFWLHRGRAEVLVRLDVVGQTPLASNHLVPVLGKASIRSGSPRRLFVPYDNDGYIRFRSDPLGDSGPDSSYEVGALFDEQSRRGLVVGSVDHNLWKSAIRFTPEGLTAFSGIADKTTRDTEPHGLVRGRTLSSARFLLGSYADWRDGLEQFGALAAKVQPPLAWRAPVPFGWNSWAGHKDKIKADGARAATDFVKDDLPQFRSGGTAYINFDSFWDNLTRPERQEFVRRAHASGLRAGIYWTPFVCWGNPTDQVAGDKYLYGDLILKGEDGKPLPKLDGGYPLDPTHPGTLARIDRQMAEFVADGFDFVKLDFLTHGALEGKHFDPAVFTGNAAYVVGMKRILDDVSPRRIGRPFFVSASIAPIFPSGFVHSRRISCDVFANIGASEYLLNSTTYGWWEDRLYRFIDPDASCVYQPLGEPVVSESEARCRVTASVVSGGMLFLGDDLRKPEARERVRKLFTNPEVLALARRALPFWPVSGDTGDKAGEAFVWRSPDGGTAYLAVFNYAKDHAAAKTIFLSRLGVDPGKTWTVHDLWTGATQTTGPTLTLHLPPTSCTLVKLSAR